MHMGQYAAENIHKHMLAECTGEKPTYKELTPFPSVIGLAIGKKCAVYTPDEGTKASEELMDIMFGKDMGNTSKIPVSDSNKSALANDCRLLELYAHVRVSPGLRRDRYLVHLSCHNLHHRSILKSSK